MPFGHRGTRECVLVAHQNVWPEGRNGLLCAAPITVSGETFVLDMEERVPTANPVIWATRPQPLPDDFASCLSRRYAAAAGADDLVRTRLADLLADCAPVIDDSGLTMASPHADEL
jgi:hypothetical protein